MSILYRVLVQYRRPPACSRSNGRLCVPITAQREVFLGPARARTSTTEREVVSRC